MTKSRLVPSENKQQNISVNRFSNHIESKSIILHLSYLEDKKKEFDKDKDNKLSYMKFTRVEKLINTLNTKIEDFNKEPTLPEQQDQENRAYMDLLKDLYNEVRLADYVNYEILNKPRSFPLRVGRILLDSSGLGIAGIGAAFSSPAIYSAALTIQFGVDAYGDRIKMTNINKLIDNFKRDLRQIIETMDGKLKHYEILEENALKEQISMQY